MELAARSSGSSRAPPWVPTGIVNWSASPLFDLFVRFDEIVEGQRNRDIILC